MTYLVYANTANLLEAAGVRCEVGDPTDVVDVPYTFVWGPLPVEYALTAAGSDDNLDVEYHVQVVAAYPAAVMKLADQVKNTLRNAVLDLPGFRVFPLKVTGSTPVQTARGVANEDTNTYPAWLTLHLRLQATKE